MELDKRIVPGKRPLSCFDTEQAMQFIGKKGYFSHYIDNYADLKNTVLGTLTSTGDTFHESFCCTEEPFDNYYYEFFLPAEWVREEKTEPEPKYRPYTIKDFEKAFLNEEFDDFIIFRDKHDHDNVYTMRYNGNYTRGKYEYICLGAKNYSFEILFENYEVADYDGNWQPFGVKEIPEIGE